MITFTLLGIAARALTLLSTCSIKLPGFKTSITSPFSHASVAAILWFNNSIDIACWKVIINKRQLITL